MFQRDCFLGIDLGTSGSRACVISENAEIIFAHKVSAPPTHNPRTGWLEQNPDDWWWQVRELVDAIPAQQRQSILALAVDGTSGTILLCDDAGRPTSPALMYNDSRAIRQAEVIQQLAPPQTGAQGASASLARLLWLLDHDFTGTHAPHQADWIAGRFRQRWGVGDENNALKLGYDPMARCWPDWIHQLPLPQDILPTVIPAGTALGRIDHHIAQQTGLPTATKIIAGTTDSIAGVIATGARETGDAVTSLGSTLVIKLISDKPVYAPEHGIYSHRFGDYWLAGGASNSGGAALRKYFSQEEMDALTPRLQPEKPTGLHYYPLPDTGERFPVHDPMMQPQVQPVADRLHFFQGLLEGIAEIEKTGYEKLAALGCPYPRKIFTTGGGANNTGWLKIRSRILQTPVCVAKQTEAAYGAALLARQGYHEQ